MPSSDAGRHVMLDNLELLADLPALSPVVSQLTAALWREDVALTDIEEVVSRDPVIAARLLGAANAATYAGYAPVDTLRAALLRLGIDRVRRLAVVVSVCNTTPGLGAPPARFWLHSLAVAIGAETLARTRPVDVQPQTAFLAGLMHDLGLLVVRSHYPRQAQAAAERAAADGVPLVEIERQLYDIDHGELGAALATYWSLPEVVTAAVRFHHAPVAAPEAHRLAAAVVRVAEAAAGGVEPQWDLRESGPRADGDPALALLGLDHREAVAIVHGVREDIAGAGAALDLAR
jgi:HD-like signal output (HDOD) protein